MNALRMFHPFTRVSHVSPTLALAVVFGSGFLFGCLLLVFPPGWICFASARSVLTSFFSDTVLDDRQCFHARSASRYKKKALCTSPVGRNTKPNIKSSPETCLWLFCFRGSTSASVPSGSQCLPACVCNRRSGSGGPCQSKRSKASSCGPGLSYDCTSEEPPASSGTYASATASALPHTAPLPSLDSPMPCWRIRHGTCACYGKPSVVLAADHLV